jgi:hypothetical protein
MSIYPPIAVAAVALGLLVTSPTPERREGSGRMRTSLVRGALYVDS